MALYLKALMVLSSNNEQSKEVSAGEAEKGPEDSSFDFLFFHSVSFVSTLQMKLVIQGLFLVKY